MEKAAKTIVDVFSALDKGAAAALARELATEGVKVAQAASLADALKAASGRSAAIVLADAKDAASLPAGLTGLALSVVLFGAPSDKALQNPAVVDVVPPGAPIALAARKVAALADNLRLADALAKLRSRGE